MKNYIILLAAVAAMFAACTRTAPETTATEKTDYAAIARQEQQAVYSDAYNRARQFGDQGSALAYTYLLMALDTNPDRWNDTLANLYINLQMADQAKMLTGRITNDSANIKLDKLQIQSLLAQGKGQEAINLTKKVYQQTGEIQLLFHLAEMYLAMDDAKTFKQTVKEIENHPQINTATVEMIDETGRGTKPVKAKAVMHLMKGMIAYEIDFHVPNARRELNAAIKADPNFAQAKMYLQQLNQRESQQ